eukprot:jgi/Bigna1/133867/aug1.23_g8575
MEIDPIGALIKMYSMLSFMIFERTRADISERALLAMPPQKPGLHAGAVVWGKFGEYPWWPAVVDPPEFQSAEHYHTNKPEDKSCRLVQFFDEDMSYAWLKPKHIRAWNHRRAWISRKSKDLGIIQGVRQAEAYLKKAGREIVIPRKPAKPSSQSHKRRSSSMAIQIESLTGAKQTKVPQSTFAVWEGLLFSSEFSDVFFRCSDSKGLVPAHCCVLAGSSEYFRKLLREQAVAEDSTNGEAKEKKKVVDICKPEAIVKGLLRFVYTGEISLPLLNMDQKELFEMGLKYGFPALIKVGEAGAAKTVSRENVLHFTKIAFQHKAKMLRDECLNFIRLNSLDFLTDKDFMKQILELSHADPELWTEISASLHNKRARKARKTDRGGA